MSLGKECGIFVLTHYWLMPKWLGRHTVSSHPSNWSFPPQVSEVALYLYIFLQKTVKIIHMIWKTFLLLWVCELGVYLFATTHRNQPYKSQSQLAYYGILCKTYSAAAADKIEPKKIKWLLENVKLLYRYSEICTHVLACMVVFFATSYFVEGPKPNQTRLYLIMLVKHQRKWQILTDCE